MKEFDSPILDTVMPKFLFEKLKEIISAKNKPHNSSLAGNIVREEALNQHIPIFRDFFSTSIQMYSPFTQSHIPQLLRRRLQREGDKVRIELKEIWVNHMKQYEFNPLHHHEGSFSFIIFVKVPFKREEMLKKSPGYKGNLNLAGAVSFMHQGSNIVEEFFTEEIIHPDERWEGKCLIFPSTLHHQVYPFYGTEETRITVSGNIYVELVQE